MTDERHSARGQAQHGVAEEGRRGSIRGRQFQGGDGQATAPMREAPEQRDRGVEPADDQAGGNLIGMDVGLIPGQDVVGKHLAIREVERSPAR